MVYSLYLLGSASLTAGILLLVLGFVGHLIANSYEKEEDSRVVGVFAVKLIFVGLTIIFAIKLANYLVAG